jgi:hypothetical protein
MSIRATPRNRCVIGQRLCAAMHPGTRPNLAACPYALDTQDPAPPPAAVDDVELEPAPRVGDDPGLGRGQSADLVGRAAQEASPEALAARRPAWRSGATMPQLAEPSDKPVAPVWALQPIHLVGPEWDEKVGAHGLLLELNGGAAGDSTIDVPLRVQSIADNGPPRAAGAPD